MALLQKCSSDFLIIETTSPTSLRTKRISTAKNLNPTALRVGRLQRSAGAGRHVSIICKWRSVTGTLADREEEGSPLLLGFEQFIGNV